MNATDLEIAEKNLRNPLWRINNLYQIIDKEGKKCTFRLNWAQEELYKNLWYCNIILKARQLGISTFVGILFLDRCLFNSNVAAGIIAHTREDAEVFFKRIKFAYDQLPEELKKAVPSKSDNARELCLANGSSLRVATSMRSSTLQYLHVSELGKLAAKYPDKAQEVVTGSLNAIAPGQYVIIESTAEGRSGVYYDLTKQAMALKDSRKSLSKLDYRFHFFPWHNPKSSYRLNPEGIVINDELNKYFEKVEAKCHCKLDAEQRAWYTKRVEIMKENMKAEFPSFPEEAFESAQDGNYYSSYLIKARRENRITKVFQDPTKPVHSSWDLGFRDSSAIWLFQIDGQRINVLEYYENSGEALPHYIQWMRSKSYNYGDHLVPHDASQHDLGTGLTRTEVAASLGVRFTQVPNLKIDEGIDAVRNILHRCYFDEEGCAKGIQMLDNYKKDWNEKQGCWSSKPLHNFASHGSDAFRMLAVGLHLVGDGREADNTNKALAAFFSSRY